MIEHVESFQPEFPRFRLGYSHQLGKRHVKVVDPRAIKESPARKAWEIKLTPYQTYVRDYIDGANPAVKSASR
jgi:hypothetical protein